MPDGRRRTESALDRALDAALSGLTEAPPPSALRERVVARIGPHAAVSLAGPRVRWSVALPAAAVLAATLWSGSWLLRRTTGRVAGDPAAVPGAAPRAATVARPAVEAPARAPVASGPMSAPRVGRTRAAAAALPVRPPMPRATAPAVRRVDAADDAGAVPRLDLPAPLAPAELSRAATQEPVPIDVPSLSVEPLPDVAAAESGIP